MNINRSGFHPSAHYRVNSSYGRFAIQQAGKGQAIQWGAYPNATYSGTYYTAVVRADGTKS